MSEPEANGRVTLALVQQSIVNLSEQVEALSQRVITRQDEHERRLRAAEDWCTKSAEKWEGHAETHKTERGIAAGAIALGTTVASAIGVWFKS